MRNDIMEAIARTPHNIQGELNGQCQQALVFMVEHLREDETVQHISSAAVNVTGAESNSVLAITNRRLIFVAPRPQAVAWHLREIDTAHAAYGFMLESGGRTTHLGIDSQWGNQFANYLHVAMAVAVLRDER